MTASNASAEEHGVEDHGEEFDPKGTLALILTYFVILLLMWVYIYFVEFLGNDLVVVG